MPRGLKRVERQRRQNEQALADREKRIGGLAPSGGFDLSAPTFNPRYDLSSGTPSDQLIKDYRASDSYKAPTSTGTGKRGRQNRVGSGDPDAGALDWGQQQNTEYETRYKETTGRRSAMKYISSRMPKIRSRGLSNRGMGANSLSLG